VLVNVLVISHGVKTNKRDGPIEIKTGKTKTQKNQRDQAHKNCNQIKNYKTRAKCLYDMAIRADHAVPTMGQFAALNKNNKNVATFVKANHFGHTLSV